MAIRKKSITFILACIAIIGLLNGVYMWRAFSLKHIVLPTDNVQEFRYYHIDYYRSKELNSLNNVAYSLLSRDIINTLSKYTFVKGRTAFFKSANPGELILTNGDKIPIVIEDNGGMLYILGSDGTYVLNDERLHLLWLNELDCLIGVRETAFPSKEEVRNR